ncbi:MAG: hypothetical protein GX182_08910 [Firmicutes bacterium]|nr:hypothetical protein [Bacillota bacterium]
MLQQSSALDRIRRLLERFLARAEEERNRERRARWEGWFADGIDQWRGVPLDAGQRRPPMVIDLQMNAWRKLLGFDMEEYYQDPVVFLENYLTIQLKRYEMFDDDYYLSPHIRLYMGAAFEITLLGGKAIFSSEEDPWPDTKVVVETVEDIEAIRESKAFAAGFQDSGLMPMARRMYDGVSQLLAASGFGAEFQVRFPLWIRGPFGVAVYLAGFNQVLTAMMVDPDFMHRLMRLVTDARKRWYEETFGKDGVGSVGGYLFNDEVNCPCLSPALYEEFVLPYEKELCDFHRGLDYWHSCGNVTQLLPLIAQIPQIKMLHVGPWTDMGEAARIFGQRSKLEICPNPEKRILQASRQETEAYAQQVKETVGTDGDKGYYLRASGLMFRDEPDEVLAKVKLWNRTMVDSLGR